MNANAALKNEPDDTYGDQQSNQQQANRSQPPASEGRVPATLYVLDTTALPNKGPREHEMIVEGLVKSFKFEPGKPTELPLPIAVKFLKHEAFKRTDADGNLLPYHRQPKQPEELGAGEKFVLADNQTVADYGELTNMALLQRALELPGGELLQEKGDRKALIDFIIGVTLQRRKANAVRDAEAADPDAFVPEAEV